MKNPFENSYQIALIALSVCIIVFFAAFAYFEVFPDYKKYQRTYVKLEEYRSLETGAPVPEFKYGIKQVLIPNDHNGPEEVDRCMSCHVPINLPHFSPLQVKRDVNGKVMFGLSGKPITEENPDFIWGKIEKRVRALRDPKLIKKLEEEGNHKLLRQQKEEVEQLDDLRWQKIGGVQVDMSKVLVAHPLIGSETQVFDLHSIEEYGCTKCHSGNGRSLLAKRAHGPYFDDAVRLSSAPSFTEIDDENDPKFSRMFNERPDHDLLFQTTPLLTGSLIESRCVQCHESSKAKLQGIYGEVTGLAKKENQTASELDQSRKDTVDALGTLALLHQELSKSGYAKTVANLKKQLENFSLSSEELDMIDANLEFILAAKNTEEAKVLVQDELQSSFGSSQMKEDFLKRSQNL